MQKALRQKSVIPGFGLTMGFTLLYLSLIVIIPLSTVLLKTLSLTWGEFWNIVTSARVMAAYRITFGTAFFAAFVNVIFGVLLAWVLVRYKFPGKKIVDGLVDLPFALPTAVAGIALTTLYASNGWIGQYLAPLGLNIVFTPIGITLALIFISLPFVVRTVQPVLENLDRETEEASVVMGAKRIVTFFRVILPELFPAILTGFALAFARAIGEYGSVVFISGNMPMKTEIVPLLIMTRLEQFDYAGATAIALVMMVISFVLLLIINFIQWRVSRRTIN